MMRTIPYKGIWLFTLLYTIFTSANDQPGKWEAHQRKNH